MHRRIKFRLLKYNLSKRRFSDNLIIRLNGYCQFKGIYLNIFIAKNSDSGDDLLKLMDNCYNFVHPHMGLNGRTPAEEANIVLKLGRNKLLNLIKIYHYFEMGSSWSMNAENDRYSILYPYN